MVSGGEGSEIVILRYECQRMIPPSMRLSGLHIIMPQRALKPDQRLREHLEDALVEADALAFTVVAALVSEALDAMDLPLPAQRLPPKAL